ncbi:putative transposase, mutator type, MULE transposase domain protein [Tanacetum coccineum]
MSVSNLTQLAVLDLGSNYFSGPIPPLGSLTKLTHLTLQLNSFDRSNICDWLGTFPNLLYLDLRLLTSLDEGLYALAREEDVRCMATIVRSFKLIEVYIKHGVTIDSYISPPRFRATIEEITDEPSSIAPVEHRSEKILLLTWHDSSEPTEEPVCESVTPRSLPEHDSSTPRCLPHCMLTPPSNEVVITYTQLSGVQGVDTQEHILPTIQSQFSDINLSFISQQANRLKTQEPVVEEGNGQKDESAPSDGQFFYDDEGIDTAYETEYDGQSSEDAGTDDNDDDEDEYFLVNEENEIVEFDVGVHLFGISMDVLFDNITNLVPDNVLEGEDMDVINADSFDSDPGNDDETSNYKRRMLAELSREMEGVINASGQWKYSFYTGQKSTTAKEAKDRLYLHSIKSRRNLKLYKNDSIRIRARCDGKVHVFTMSQDTGPIGLNREMEVGPSGSSGPSTRSKKKEEEFRVFQRIYVCLGALKLGFRACGRELLGLDGAFMKGPFPGQVLIAVGHDSNNGIYPLAYALVEAESKSSWCWFYQCLGDDIDLHPNSNFTFISDRQKGIIPAIKTVFPSAKHRYCLRHIHENMKQGWCGQAYKDLLWRSASATSVKKFEKCRTKSDLLLNNICEVFNDKIVKGRDKPVITPLEYIREYCMKRTVNIQSVIDKCTGPLTPAATRIMESIKKEAHLMKVQWNGSNKYQVLGSLSNQYVVDVASTTSRPAVCQDGSGVGAVIGLSAAVDGAGAACRAVGAGVGVGSQGSSHSRWSIKKSRNRKN